MDKETLNLKEQLEKKKSRINKEKKPEVQFIECPECLQIMISMPVSYSALENSGDYLLIEDKDEGFLLNVCDVCEHVWMY